MRLTVVEGYRLISATWRFEPVSKDRWYTQKFVFRFHLKAKQPRPVIEAQRLGHRAGLHHGKLSTYPFYTAYLQVAAPRKLHCSFGG